MRAAHQASPGDDSDRSTVRALKPGRVTRAAGRRVVATAVAAGTVLLAAACTSGGSSVESAATVASSVPAPASASGATTSVADTTMSSSTRSSASSSAASSGPSSSGTVPSGGDAAGAAYCQSKGGQAQTRDATFGTNGPQTSWLPMAGSTQVCRFQADDEARSRIYVDFATLTSARPTLAGLAYLSRPPLPTANGGGNPATGYCTKLGGSSTFGEVSANGGGWVNKDDPDDVVVGLCVFPDLSFIDEWGLAYHAGGVVRGRDLTQVMTYQPPSPLPDVFPIGTPSAQPGVEPGSPAPSAVGSATPSAAPTS